MYAKIELPVSKGAISVMQEQFNSGNFRADGGEALWSKRITLPKVLMFPLDLVYESTDDNTVVSVVMFDKMFTFDVNATAAEVYEYADRCNGFISLTNFKVKKPVKTVAGETYRPIAADLA